MLIQNANEAALCKSFCLILTGATRQWYRRLTPGSIGYFKQLANAFAAAFLSSKTRKLGASHLFGIKQGETLMQAFREGIKDARLVWTLAYDRPLTFAQLRGSAWRHAEADEYVRGRDWTGTAPRPTTAPGRSCTEKSKQVLQLPQGCGPRHKGLHTAPRPDRAADSHGHLREFVERIITPTGPSRPAQATRRNPRPSDQTDEQEQEHIVHTIFGGMATGDTTSSRISYVCEARRYARGEYINMAEHISKVCRQDSAPITFTDDKTDRLLHPHNKALIGEIRVAGNVIRRVLIDNGSSADIMFMDAFSRLKIEGAGLTPARTPLYGFSGERSSVPRTSRLGWTRLSATSPSPSCPRTGKRPGGSRTPRRGLMVGHRPELEVPDQDPPALAGIPTSVVLGPQS
ncbi:hypothetical protein TIFTF001_038183 [Ficus carica]|uniref:Retrotransposon gag domain-containing protein n=1 Tax=Ficus carica TaxID=3494 RepID=A0AA88EI55_FICCA|nr:hypothetical protein TIFTF001_038171 [Ficus carica]GMN69134.1 hypothetical protein TIFTF001_038183 [Ficus carica]